MNKYFLIGGGIILLCLIGVLLFFLLRNTKVEGAYYVRVNDGNEPGSTYTLNIDKDGNYDMNDHFTAALADGIEEKDTNYSGKLSSESLSKIESIAKKLNSKKDGYALYIEPDIDYEDGKWCATSQLVRAISFLGSKDEKNVKYGNCILDEIIKLKLNEMPDKLNENIYINCRR